MTFGRELVFGILPTPSMLGSFCGACSEVVERFELGNLYMG